MGLDGFSMSNLGLHRDLTSAQMSNQAEVLATKGLEFKIKDVAEAASQKGVKRKEDDSDGGGASFEDNSKQSKEQHARDEIQNRLKEQEFERQDPKEFSVRINPSNEMIELYNNKNNRIIESISANDLMVLISKMDSASGILVNRKI